MSKKPRENRVPIMMSDAELKSIDDWRFSNRVATRSDAVRRLCQVGIVYSHELGPVVDETIEFIRPIFAGERSAITAEERDRIFNDMMMATINTATSLMALKSDSTDEAVEKLLGLYDFYKSYDEKNPKTTNGVRVRPLHWRKSTGGEGSSD